MDVSPEQTSTCVPLSRKARWGRRAVVTGAVCAIALVALWAGILALAATERERAVALGMERSRTAALAARTVIGDRIRTIDGTLRMLRSQWEESPAKFAAHADHLRLILGQGLLETHVIGADGVVVFSDVDPKAAGADLGQRDQFRSHLDSGGVDRLFVSQPVLDKISGKWSVQFTRPLHARDGAFAGVVVLSVSPRELVAVQQTIDLGDDGSLALVGEDGIIRAVHAPAPGEEPLLGQKVPADRPYLETGRLPTGSFLAPGLADGKVQFFHWAQLDELPLVVVAAIGESALVQAAERVAQGHFLAAWFCTFAILAIGAMAFAWPRQPRPQAQPDADPTPPADGFTRFREDTLKTHRHFQGLTVGGAILITVAGIATGWGYLSLERRHAIETGEETTEWQARRFSSYVTRMLSEYERDLARIRILLANSDDPAIRRVLMALAQDNPEVLDIQVLDPNGRIRLWTGEGPPPDVHDRPYFVWHRDNPGDGLAVSPPLASKANAGRPFFALSRRLAGPQGEFGGVIAILLSVDAISDAASGLIRSDRNSLLLATTEGISIFRLPRRVGDSGTAIPEVANHKGGMETLHVRSPFDGSRRIVSQTRAENFPIILGASVDLDSIERELRNKQVMVAGLVALGLVAVVLMTRFILGLGRSRLLATMDLEDERRRIANVLEGTNVGTWEWDLVTGETRFNERWAEIIGHSLRDLGATTIETWAAYCHPDDLARSNQLIQRTLSGEDAYYSCECRMRHRDGSWVWVLDRGKVVDWDDQGRPRLMAGTHTDISDLKQAEQEATESRQRLQHLMACVGEGVFGIDAHGRCTWINPSALALLGRTEADTIGADALAWFPPAGEGAADDLLRLTLGDGTTRAGEGELVRYGGEPLPIYHTVAPLLDEHGAVKGAVVSFHDIVGRKEAEARMRRSNEELEQFAFVVSHDLRAPLRMVNSFAGLLERTLAPTLDEESKEYLGFVRSGATRMDQMLVSLLEYSRLGHSGEPMEEIDCGTVVDEALSFLAPALQDCSASVHLPQSWPSILASRNEAVRLFQNLLGNAIKYRLPDRPPEITMTVDAQGNEWLFAIRDNGIGIPPDQIDRLFKVFQRLHGETAYEGTGIGLAVCRRIVERHHGRIWLTSDGDGHGCTVWFTFPKIGYLSA